MATKAYVLIETAVGKTREVVAYLKQLPGVRSADVVTGPYDIIAIVEGTDLGSIGDMGHPTLCCQDPFEPVASATLLKIRGLKK